MGKVILRNKKASFNYELLDNYTAGLVLYGFEVKSLKLGHGSFEGSYVTEDNGEMFLVNFYIPPFQAANSPKDYDPYRRRKLLLNKREINEIARDRKIAGLTLVPKNMQLVRNRVKLEFALARGKKKHDKRQTIKKRDMEREVGRSFK